MVTEITMLNENPITMVTEITMLNEYPIQLPPNSYKLLLISWIAITLAQFLAILFDVITLPDRTLEISSTIFASILTIGIIIFLLDDTRFQKNVLTDVFLVVEIICCLVVIVITAVSINQKTYVDGFLWWHMIPGLGRIVVVIVSFLLLFIFYWQRKHNNIPEYGGYFLLAVAFVLELYFMIGNLFYGIKDFNSSQNYDFIHAIMDVIFFFVATFNLITIIISSLIVHCNCCCNVNISLRYFNFGLAGLTLLWAFVELGLAPIFQKKNTLVDYVPPVVYLLTALCNFMVIIVLLQIFQSKTS